LKFYELAMCQKLFVHTM